MTHSLVQDEQHASQSRAPASRLMFLGLAIAWSALAVMVLLSYRVAEPLRNEVNHYEWPHILW